MEARALWIPSPGVAELRTEEVAPPEPHEIAVKAIASGISTGTGTSTGTEMVLFRGLGPPGQEMTPSDVRGELDATGQVRLPERRSGCRGRLGLRL